MQTSINITPTEFQSRAARRLDHVRVQGLSGVALFDNYYILYFRESVKWGNLAHRLRRHPSCTRQQHHVPVRRCADDWGRRADVGLQLGTGADDDRRSSFR
jgi:hypothetical protein